jgi:hypothetical protein
MASAPDASLPKQCGSWPELKAGYRLLNHDAVDPHAIQQPHRQLTHESCGEHPIVLCVQDDTILSFNHRGPVRGLGRLNDGGQGLIQHTTLAVWPDGELLGVLDQGWFTRVEAGVHETRHQRHQRWRETQVWSDAVRAVGVPPDGTRFIHVMDRAGDSLETIAACRETGVGFVIRARHDRRVNGCEAKLWSQLLASPVVDRTQVKVTPQRGDRGQVKRRARTAKVSIRFQAVQLEPPWNHPGPSQPESVWAISVHEDRLPTDGEPIDWLLLTSEAVSTAADAQRIIGWYQHRWVIEEYHRVEKEGCRLEASQLDDAKDIERLASIIGVIAVRLLQLRDLAGCGEQSASDASGSADPQRLRRVVPMLWIEVVAGLAQVDAEQLTPRQFWHAIARQGGWLARRSDGRPGWKVIWRGWYDVQNMVAGAALMRARHRSPQKCG